jgi:hypothetical protein
MSPTTHQPTPISLAQRLRTLPWTTRLAGCLALVLLLIAGVMSNRSPRSAQLVSLLGETRLQSLDLQRMRLALARAGIVDTEVRSEQLWLPKEKVAAALKTVHEQDLLPGNLQTSTLTAPQVSPFASRYQQQLQQQHQKKVAIQALLRRLAFVAEASLEIDFLEAIATQPENSMRCTITIQPLDGHYLEPAQLETVRQIALGSLSQLRRENLVIVDLAAGMAFDDKLLAQPQTAEQIRAINLLRCRQKLDREIHQALAEFGKVDIEITCRESSPPNLPFAPGSIDSATAERPRAMLASAQMSLPGTNGIASVSAATVTKDSESRSGFGSSDTGNEHFEFQPVVTIRLATEELTKSANASESLAWSMEQDQTRQEILRRVRPLLPERAFNEPGNDPVVIEFLSSSPPNPSSTRLSLPLGDMLGSRSGGIWIAVLSTAGLGLLLVLSMRRRDRVESCPATEEPSMGESNVREQQLREQIDELLRTHPDTAANVIRDWIQKAA